MISKTDNLRDHGLAIDMLEDLTVVMPCGFIQPVFRNRMQKFVNELNALRTAAENDFDDIWEEGPHNG